MALERFFKHDVNGNPTMELDWDYIDAIPEFSALEKCEQNKKWHGEGNVLQHVRSCIDAAYKTIDAYYFYDFEKRIMLVAVLFHDIGKCCTTEFKNGTWHAYGHESVGEKITRRILWEEQMEIRERICCCVRYHMKPLNMADAKGSEMFKNIITPTFNRYFSWKDVLFVKRCDNLGSIPENPNETYIGISKLNMLENFMYSLNLYNNSCTNYDMYNTFVLGKKNNWSVLKINNPKVYVMIGLPGSGKNTWIEKQELVNNSDYVILSRDDIRAELGFCGEGEKVILSQDKEEKVSEVFDQRFIEAVANGKNVVLNNINLKKTYREAYKKLLTDNGLNYVEWIYIYIEARDIEMLLERRTMISRSTFENMIEKFDFPQPGEYDNLCILKQ